MEFWEGIFFQRMRAQICYESRTLALQNGDTSIKKRLCHIQAAQETAARTITLPQRAETIVRLPVMAGTEVTEGLVERKELAPGVYMAGCIARVVDGHILTSVVNTREEEVRVDSLCAEVEEFLNEDIDFALTGNIAEQGKGREETVLKQLRLSHLNSEKENLFNVCVLTIRIYFSYLGIV